MAAAASSSFSSAMNVLDGSANKRRRLDSGEEEELTTTTTLPQYRNVDLAIAIENLSLQWLMDNPRYADLRIVLHRTGIELKVCSGLLAALSPVFKAMFEHKMRENLTAELHINKPTSNCNDNNYDEESPTSDSTHSRVSIGEIGDDETALANMIELLFKGKITLRNGPFPKEFNVDRADEELIAEDFDTLPSIANSSYDPMLMQCYSSIWAIMAIAEKYDISVLRESIVRTVGAWLKEHNVVVAAEWICRSSVMGVPPPPKLVAKVRGVEKEMDFIDYSEHVIASRPVKHFWLLNNLPLEIFQRILQRDDLNVTHESQVLLLIKQYVASKDFMTEEERSKTQEKLLRECVRPCNLGYKKLKELMNSSLSNKSDFCARIVETLLRGKSRQKRRDSYEEGIFLHARSNRIPSAPGHVIPPSLFIPSLSVTGHHPTKPARTQPGMPPAPGYQRNDQVLDFTGSVTVVSSIYLWLEGVAIYRKRGPGNAPPPVEVFRLEFADSKDPAQSFFVEALIDEKDVAETPDAYSIRLPQPILLGPNRVGLDSLRIGVAYKPRASDVSWQCYALPDNFQIGQYTINGSRREELAIADLPFLHNMVSCTSKLKESGIAGFYVWVPSFKSECFPSV